MAKEGKSLELRAKSLEQGTKSRKAKLPIWKTAKHSTEVVSKVTLPHAVDSFTAQHMMADALPACCGVVSLEVKYVIFANFGDSRKLSNECWEEYMEATRGLNRKGGAK